MEKTFLSYQDVADELGLSVRTIKRLVAERRLRPARISTHTVRFLASAVEQFVRDTRDQEPQPA
jgi:excisionase family DNA binding protein